MPYLSLVFYSLWSQIRSFSCNLDLDCSRFPGGEDLAELTTRFWGDPIPDGASIIVFFSGLPSWLVLHKLPESSPLESCADDCGIVFKVCTCNGIFSPVVRKGAVGVWRPARCYSRWWVSLLKLVPVFCFKVDVLCRAMADACCYWLWDRGDLLTS